MKAQILPHKTPPQMEKSTKSKMARFVFEKWEDADLKKKYHGDPGYFFDELRRAANPPAICESIGGIYFPGSQFDP